MIYINITAVLAVAVIQMALGALWYGPLFGKPWIRLVGFKARDKEETAKKGMGKTYFVAFLGSLVTAYVLAQFVYLIGPYGAVSALQLGFWLWLGFVATTMLSQVLWLNKPVQLYVLDSSYYLVSLLLMSVILALWR